MTPRSPPRDSVVALKGTRGTTTFPIPDFRFIREQVEVRPAPA